MESAVSKTYKYLRILFILCLLFMIAAFIVNTLYAAKHIPETPNVILERWSIILTMGGIVGSLKLLHPKLKDNDRKEQSYAIRKYRNIYIYRLIALLSVFIFNLISLNFTGTKNFVFLAFITIFAMLLCIPNQKHLKEETSTIKLND